MNQYGGGPKRPLPYTQRNFTLLIISINVGVFFLSYIMPRLTAYLAISPYALLRLGFIWTPLTYMFAHGGFTHLLFNMLFLFFVGPSLENRMGSWEFLIYYLFSGVMAGLFSMFAYLFTGMYAPIVGASGAIYALMLAFAAFYPRAQFLIFFVLPMRAPMALALFAGIDLISNFTGGSGVAHLTHLSGLGFGYLYFVIRLRIDPIKAMRDGR